MVSAGTRDGTYNFETIRGPSNGAGIKYPQFSQTVPQSAPHLAPRGRRDVPWNNQSLHFCSTPVFRYFSTSFDPKHYLPRSAFHNSPTRDRCGTYSLHVPFPVFSRRTLTNHVIPHVPCIINHRSRNAYGAPGEGDGL